MEQKLWLTIRFCVLVFLLSSANAFHSSTQDNSPYCEDLARITRFCDDVINFMICPKTCNSGVPTKCGQRKFGKVIKESEKVPVEEELVPSPKRFRRIVGGSKSVQGSWPWSVSLRYKGIFKCAGAIISKDWILTAANCFDSDFSSHNAKDWQIVAGDHQILGTEDVEQITGIKNIIIHPKNFKFWKIGYFNIPDDYDVALLKLIKPLVLNDYVSPVCLENPADHFDSTSQCRVMGWGKFQGSHIVHNIPREAQVTLVSRATCNKANAYNGSIHQRAICGKFSNINGIKSDACNQDSGGALSCKKNGKWTAVGLISWGYSCGGLHSSYSVFTNLRMMRGWIVDTLLGYDDQMSAAYTITEVLEKLTPNRLPSKDFRKPFGPN